MGTKDITRLLNQPAKHYGGARMQQGRTLLDSDFNESAALHQESRRRAVLDLVGPAGSPDQGFSLGQPLPDGALFSPAVRRFLRALRDGDPLAVRQFQINGQATNVHPVSLRAGVIYAGGMRFELGDVEPFPLQRGFLQMKPSDLPPVIKDRSPSPFSPRSPRSPTYPEFRNFYYLDAWEQAVTSVEDEEFLERGLGGPDSAVRVRRMRRVEALSDLGPELSSSPLAFEELIRRLESANGSFARDTGELRSTARLQLTFEQPVEQGPCPPCEPTPGPQFTGSEDETLRIMLTGPDTYVWALDDAAPLYRIQITGLGNRASGPVTVKMLTPPRDVDHQVKSKRVVEIIPFGAVLEGGDGERPTDPHFQKIADEVGVFARVHDAYRSGDKTFTLEGGGRVQAIKDLVYQWDPQHPAAARLDIGPTDGSDARFFYMRVWHEAARARDVELPLNRTPDATPLGDTGVVPIFHGNGRRGDFWVAALRVSAPERIVPFDLLSNPGGVPPHGPRHFYAPIALIHGDNQQVFSVSDGRPRMRRMTERGCATRTVGEPGVSLGDFEKIQDAIDSLPVEGGLVEIHPGTYRERVVIQDRGRVAIQGCGESTILEPPLPGPTTPVPADADDVIIDVQQSNGVTITGLALHPSHIAIRAQQSSEVALMGLNVQAGAVTASGIDLGAPGDSQVPLLMASDVDGLIASDLVITAQRRPALSVSDSQHVTVRRMRCQGLDLGGDPGVTLPAPLLAFNQVSSALVADAVLHPYRQLGVAVTSGQDVTLRGLIIQASALPGSASDETDTQTAVDIDGGSGVRLEESHITMDADFTAHAAVVVQGDQHLIERNHIEAIPSTAATFAAWGGLQVRGGTKRLQLRENRIVGGLGHGITLGSVLWTAPGLAPLRLGAGAGQTDRTVPTPVVTGDLRGRINDQGARSAADEGVISDIVIAENRIEGMGTNGISALTILGLQAFTSGALTGGALLELDRAVIERNTITGNLRQLSTAVPTATDFLPFSTSRQVPDLQLPVLPFAGIAIAIAAGGLDIRGNTISGNGNFTDTAALATSGQTLPMSGIFVLAGDSICISENRITDTGLQAAATGVQPGVRAGIAVLLAGAGSVNDVQVDSVGQINGILAAPSSGVAAGDLGAPGLALRVSRNIVRQPEGRALQIVASGPVDVDGNYLSSLGNHGADVLAEQMMVGDVVFIENLAQPWEGAALPKSAADFAGFPGSGPVQRYVTNAVSTSAGASEAVSSPRLFLGLGGGVLFHNNQVTFDWHVVRLPTNGAPLSFFPVAVLSLDHAGVNANQFALRLQAAPGLTLPPFGSVLGQVVSPGIGDPDLILSEEPLFGHVLIGGGTVEAVSNRFSEALIRAAAAGGGAPVQAVTPAFVSLATFGVLLNTTAFNQGTRPMLAYVAGANPPSGPNDPQSLEATRIFTGGNQVLFRVSSPGRDQAALNSNPTLRDLLNSFVQLMYTAATNALRILTVSPPDDIHVNDIVTVTGTNLGLAEGTTQITIGGTAATSIISGDDSQIVFRVPPLPGLSGSGTQLALDISNQASQDSRTLTFFPVATPLSGPVAVEYLSATPAPLSAASPMLLRYRLTSSASANGAFAITPLLSVTGWTVAILDGNQQPIPPAGLNLIVGAAVDILVSLTPVGASTGQFFTAGVTVAAGAAGGTSGLQGFTLGLNAPAPDPTITLTFQSAVLAGNVTFADDTITASGVNSGVQLTFSASFSTPGHYVAAIAQKAPASGWGTAVTGPLPAIINAGDTSVHPVKVGIAVTAGTPTAGFVQFIITNTDTNVVVQSVLFSVQPGP
jgi:hypothetical protein